MHQHAVFQKIRGVEGFVNGDQTHAPRFARRVRRPLEQIFSKHKEHFFCVSPSRCRILDKAAACVCLCAMGTEHRWQYHKQRLDAGGEITVLTEEQTPLPADASSAFGAPRLGLLRCAQEHNYICGRRPQGLAIMPKNVESRAVVAWSGCPAWDAPLPLRL